MATHSSVLAWRVTQSRTRLKWLSSSNSYLQHSMAPTLFRVKAKVLLVAHMALSDLTLFSFLSLSSINRPLILLCSTHTGLLKILQTCQAHFLLWSLELNVLECLECFCPDTHIDNSLTSFKSLFQSFLFNRISSGNSILCSFLFIHPGIHASPTPFSWFSFQYFLTIYFLQFPYLLHLSFVVFHLLPECLINFPPLMYSKNK